MPARFAPFLFSLALILVAVACAPAAASPTPTPVTDLTFMIPRGTYQRQLRGEIVEAIPSELILVAGQAVVVRNEDEAMHYFFDAAITPGGELRMAFTKPGTFGYSGGVSCSVSKTGSIAVTVNPRGGNS